MLLLRGFKHDKLNSTFVSCLSTFLEDKRIFQQTETLNASEKAADKINKQVRTWLAFFARVWLNPDVENHYAQDYQLY